MTAKCSKCGAQWKVSIHKDLDSPFVCPRCSSKTKFKTTLFFAGLIASCLIIPKLNCIANDARGYQAVGGEIFIPLLYLLVAALIREIGGFL
ncbi:hypothetical protein CLHUN_01580 [Ruminiclostridium hungatei]|uniref:Uncharacterized protein n=1 Tax=Ruminiclostridium hungatei TaxID=48256 RepID=A0A1V4SR53_RUMHU|nr:hypothetical protein CLHUN_01580 [Ruminiclostridium hungatei]